MIAYRGLLSAAFVVVGAIVFVRVLAFGIRMETLPGLVLGAAMIMLGVHRLKLIWGALRREAR